MIKEKQVRGKTDVERRLKDNKEQKGEIEVDKEQNMDAGAVEEHLERDADTCSHVTVFQSADQHFIATVTSAKVVASCMIDAL